MSSSSPHEEEAKMIDGSSATKHLDSLVKRRTSYLHETHGPSGAASSKPKGNTSIAGYEEPFKMHSKSHKFADHLWHHHGTKWSPPRSWVEAKDHFVNYFHHPYLPWLPHIRSYFREVSAESR